MVLSAQEDAGHSVPSHCLLAAIFARAVFLAINGQSAAVAAQYIPSGQQYHPTYGQHPPGHSVPSHCLLAAILARGYKWAVSSSD